MIQFLQYTTIAIMSISGAVLLNAAFIESVKPEKFWSDSVLKWTLLAFITSLISTILL